MLHYLDCWDAHLSRLSTSRKISFLSRWMCSIFFSARWIQPSRWDIHSNCLIPSLIHFTLVHHHNLHTFHPSYLTLTFIHLQAKEEHQKALQRSDEKLIEHLQVREARSRRKICEIHATTGHHERSFHPGGVKSTDCADLGLLASAIEVGSASGQVCHLMLRCWAPLTHSPAYFAVRFARGV